MAHWAEIDENNVVVRVTVGDNNDLNGDEGYQWLIDNLGGTWIKTSFNTINGEHLLGGTPLRWTFAGVGFQYVPELDIFVEPKPYAIAVLNAETKQWEPPFPKPDSGFWKWDIETLGYVEDDTYWNLHKIGEL